MNIRQCLAKQNAHSFIQQETMTLFTLLFKENAKWENTLVSLQTYQLCCRGPDSFNTSL